jgi:sigma-E factor negative regulatory protein RseA
MKEQLSALMDGQLDDAACDGCLRRLKDDDELRDDWAVYHLIGDALRGTPARAMPGAFTERLSAEPTVLAPRAAPRRPSARRQAWYALSAAASVAAVAAVGWVALPMIQPATAPIAQLPAGTPTTAQVAPVAQIVPVATGVGDYVLAHQRFSPRSAMAGVMPYVGSVADDAGRR